MSDDRDGGGFLDRDVLDAVPTVVYRPVPGFPRHRIGSNRSVWFNRTLPGLPPPHDAPRWRRLATVRIDGRDGYVRMRHGGRQHVRSVALLSRAAFAPDPVLWLDRIGPRPPRPRQDLVLPPDPIAPAPTSSAPASRSSAAPDHPTVGTPPAVGPIPDEVPCPEVLYRPIPRFPGYRLGIDRSVWSCHDRNRGGITWPPSWHRLAATPRPGKGVCVCLSRGGRKFVRSVDKLHREIFPAEEFAPELPTGPPSLARGEDHGRALLTEAQVIEARRLHAAGWSERRLAGHLGVAPSTVHYALTGHTWGHVPRG